MAFSYDDYLMCKSIDCLEYTSMHLKAVYKETQNAGYLAASVLCDKEALLYKETLKEAHENENSSSGQ